MARLLIVYYNLQNDFESQMRPTVHDYVLHSIFDTTIWLPRVFCCQ